MHRKKHRIFRVQCYPGFQVSTGGLGTYSCGWGGALYSDFAGAEDSPGSSLNQAGPSSQISQVLVIHCQDLVLTNFPSSQWYIIPFLHPSGFLITIAYCFVKGRGYSLQFIKKQSQFWQELKWSLVWSAFFCLWIALGFPFWKQLNCPQAIMGKY